MIDVLLIAPPSRMDNHYRPPLSIMYVASYYRDQGFSVKIADFPFTEHIRNQRFWKNKNEWVAHRKDKVLSEVVRSNPKLIGISCYSTEYDEVRDLIFCIKRLSSARIIVGGTHATLKPDDFDGLADKVIRGRRDASYACYDLVDMKHYLTPNPYAIRGVLLSCGYVISGFRCPSQCTFCVATKLWEHLKGESKTAEALYKEVMELKHNYKVDAFYILDDLYTINKKRVQEFCKLIRHEGLWWGCNSRINTLDEETIKAMAQAGCIQLDFGVERGSDEALRYLKKGITIKQIKEAFRLCHKYRVRTFANFLVNIPGETKKDWMDIERLIKEIKPTITCINVYQQYLGCELQGQEPSDELMKWKRSVMVRSNWSNFIKPSSLRYIKFKYLSSFLMLLKEGINQLCGR